jgi:glycosyltransferase involved in cell wall biosynthesis
MCDNEKHALYFSKQKDSLRNLINEIEQNYDIILKMRKTSRERIVENYTWEKITQQYISLFNKMLND